MKYPPIFMYVLAIWRLAHTTSLIDWLVGIVLCLAFFMTLQDDYEKDADF